MTATQEPSSFQSNFHADEIENLNSLTSDKVSSTAKNLQDQSENYTVKEEVIKNSHDPSNEEISEASAIKKLEEHNLADTDSKDESETSEKPEEDEWLDIMGSGDFKKKVSLDL